MKTFNDFVKLACRTYHLDFKEARTYVLLQLGQFKLNKLSIVCYINWADGDCLTQKEIAKELGVTQQAVDYHLSRLQRVWPHLFKFGSKPPSLKYMSRLPDDYEQSTDMGAQINHRF